ncbi:unnamed protein product [Acanthoscelides obtectus]|uniref:Uncharacterized protein n=1 Tax=Acanthoscelides obtectus TaxID=200917 RepID=A0A9P0LBN8_ACAOB|nr:unnamed protein product [Acanthoscelides obtectus]CAK1626549.1 hypothetical protein AOBTE_LOCUS3920 [Acanthoscelides obtectus]
MARPKVKLNEDPYYGPLINDYITKIIKSGFLLDEDMECILDEFTSIDPPPSQRHEIPKKTATQLFVTVTVRSFS